MIGSPALIMVENWRVKTTTSFSGTLALKKGRLISISLGFFLTLTLVIPFLRRLKVITLSESASVSPLTFFP